MESAYRHCQQLVRASDKDRFIATLFAPAGKRGPLCALYAFSLEIAGVRDRVREPMAGEIRLQWWRDVLEGERSGEGAANPVAAALLDTVARFALPTGPLLDVIEAHAFDLYDDPMPTLTAFEAYARKTSSSLFALAARICIGGAEDGAKAAEAAGLACAITDVLRNFARLAARGQLPIPVEVLERHGAHLDDLAAGRTTVALGAALAELRGAARLQVAAFADLLPQVPKAAMPALLPVSLVPGYLAAMERPYDPFRTAIEVAQWRRQWTLWRAARRYARVMRD